MRFFALILASCAYGFLAAWLLGRVRVSPVVNRMVAHVLSFRLFIDEPRLVFGAVVDLFRENGRLLRLIGVPCLILGAAFWGAEEYFGAVGIRAGQVFVVSARAGSPLPEGLAAETPEVRVARLGRIYWRVRATRESGGHVDMWWVWFFGISGAAAKITSSFARESA